MLADSIVARTLEIIRHLQPKGWLMENPATGLLKTREVVAGIPFRDVCYCTYSDGLRHKSKANAAVGRNAWFCATTNVHSEIALSILVDR